MLLQLVLLTAVVLAPVGARASDDDYRMPSSAELAAVNGPASVAADTSIVYRQALVKANKVGMTLSNYGFIGSNFVTRAPSFEYPLGTQFQHLIRAGIWVGGGSYDENGAFTGVSTSAMDGLAGSSPYAGDEFTPSRGDAGNIFRRSSLPEDQFSAAGSVSEADFISVFSDMPSNDRTGNAENHRSLHVTATQYNYAWSFSDYAHMLFFHYVIRNDGPALNDAWIGLYAELASGDMKQSTGSSLYAGWFQKKQVGWIDSQNLFTERYCLIRSLAFPIPLGCHYDLVPELVGIKLLGVSPGSIADTSDKKVTLACWSYNRGSTDRDEDVERYAIMSSGTKISLSPMPDSLNVSKGDPVELIAAGPFRSIASGDSVSIDFVMIGATDAMGAPGSTPVESLLVKRAVVAQRAYDLHYVVPVPPPSPKMMVVPHQNAVDFFFTDAPESFEDPTSRPNPKDFEGYRLYAGEDRENLHMVAQFDLKYPPNDTTGFNTGMDSLMLRAPYVGPDGTIYKYSYRLGHLRDGFKYWGAVTSYDVGSSQIESLESGTAQNEVMFVPGPTAAEAVGTSVTVFPNPYRVETAWDAGQVARQHYLWFANMPSKSTLKIYTLSGALIYETDFNGATYDGRNARGVYTPGSDLRSNLSGTMFGWDLITQKGQAAATGLYLWAVEDKQTGKRQTGKFLLVKSDRENF
jgi:hypothetical protein